MFRYVQYFGLTGGDVVSSVDASLSSASLLN